MASKAKRRRKKSSWPYGLIALCLLVGGSLIAMVYIVFLHEPVTVPPAMVEKPAPAPPASLAAPPRHDEVSPPPPVTALPETATPVAPAPAARAKPMLAIVIDDMGYRKDTGRQMLDLPLNLSFSFLPFSPHTAELVKAARQDGRDILLHLPMEPTDRKWDPGPGTLLLAMSDPDLRRQFAKDLAAVPAAIGFNNHMGSRFTENTHAMEVLLGLAHEHRLFFLDSLTSSKSVGRRVAQQKNVPFVPRHVFLDNDQDKAKITRQLDALLALAEKRGWAIGIGHPHPATLEALAADQEKITARVELVGIGTLVRAHAQ